MTGETNGSSIRNPFCLRRPKRPRNIQKSSSIFDLSIGKIIRWASACANTLVISEQKIAHPGKIAHLALLLFDISSCEKIFCFQDKCTTNHVLFSFENSCRISTWLTISAHSLPNSLWRASKISSTFFVFSLSGQKSERLHISECFKMSRSSFFSALTQSSFSVMSAVHLDQILRSIGSCTVDAESLIPESQEWPLRRFQHGRTMLAPDKMRQRLYTVRSCPLDTIHDLGREGAVQCCDTIERRRRSSSAEPTLQLAAEQETRRRSHIRGALKVILHLVSFFSTRRKEIFAVRHKKTTTEI